jgi:hypothetical protein
MTTALLEPVRLHRPAVLRGPVSPADPRAPNPEGGAAATSGTPWRRPHSATRLAVCVRVVSPGAPRPSGRQPPEPVSQVNASDRPRCVQAESEFHRATPRVILKGQIPLLDHLSVPVRDAGAPREAGEGSKRPDLGERLDARRCRQRRHNSGAGPWSEAASRPPSPQCYGLCARHRVTPGRSAWAVPGEVPSSWAVLLPAALSLALAGILTAFILQPRGACSGTRHRCISSTTGPNRRRVLVS